MKKVLSIIFITISYSIIAQNSVIYEAEKKPIKIGKYKYILDYEYNYQSEGKSHSFSEVLVKGNKKQYISHFVYQLKGSTEIHISPDNPSPIQIKNTIIQSSNSHFDIENERIIITTNYYNEKEPKEKEIKILQQSKKGFFYTKEITTYYKNGEIKKETDLPQKIEFYKIPF